MTGKDLVRREKAKLAQHSDDMVQRGLQLINEIEPVEYALTEEELLPFKKKLDLHQRSIGKTPSDFLNGETASPHGLHTFMPIQWLYVLDQLYLRSPYTLDYVYAFDGHGGEPLVYGREFDDQPLSTPDEYYQKFAIPRKEMLLGDEPTPEDSYPYLNFVYFEPSRLGFVQFALFCFLCRRFYLFWHSNYNDRKYILTRDDLGRFIRGKVGQISEEEAGKLNAINIHPRVLLAGGNARVALLTYESSRGYSLLNVHIRRPNILVGYEDELIVESHEPKFLY